MEISPEQNLKLVVFIDGDSVSISESEHSKLLNTYLQCVEDRKTQAEIRSLRKEILLKKIRQLTKDAPIPQILIQSGASDELFDIITMFIDTCKHIRDSSPEWEVNEKIFSHQLFLEMSETFAELSVALREKIMESEKTFELCDNLFKVIMAQAYLPCNIILTIKEAKKIVPKMSDDINKAILTAIKNEEQFESFSDLTFSCKKIIELRKNGDTGSEELKELNNKVGKVFLAKVFVMFRDEKLITDFAQDMLIAVELAKPTSSWFW